MEVGGSSRLSNGVNGSFYGMEQGAVAQTHLATPEKFAAHLNQGVLDLSSDVKILRADLTNTRVLLFQLSAELVGDPARVRAKKWLEPQLRCGHLASLMRHLMSVDPMHRATVLGTLVNTLAPYINPFPADTPLAHLTSWQITTALEQFEQQWQTNPCFVSRLNCVGRKDVFARYMTQLKACASIADVQNYLKNLINLLQQRMLSKGSRHRKICPQFLALAALNHYLITDQDASGSSAPGLGSSDRSCVDSPAAVREKSMQARLLAQLAEAEVRVPVPVLVSPEEEYQNICADFYRQAAGLSERAHSEQLRATSAELCAILVRLAQNAEGKRAETLVESMKFAQTPPATAVLSKQLYTAVWLKLLGAG
ncbi:MAG: hypothetical protein V4623_06470 [Pseudomonadota bacterium]